MTDRSDIFEKNVQEYQEQLSTVDFDAVKETLGILSDSGGMWIPFFDTRYAVSRDGIVDASGSRPDYRVSVVLSKYILLCPEKVYQDEQWASFKDFKLVSHFTNVNFFASDTESALESHFSGRLSGLEKACKELGGQPHEMETPYDLSVTFEALPRISLLLLFNDGDDEFPARGTVLFQRHAERYLDPESLAITSAALVRRLKQQDSLGTHLKDGGNP